MAGYIKLGNQEVRQQNHAYVSSHIEWIDLCGAGFIVVLGIAIMCVDNIYIYIYFGA